MKFKFQEPLKIFSLGIVLALRKANFVTKILAYTDKSALCRSTSGAFSFVFFHTLSDVLLQYFFDQRSGKRNQSVIFTRCEDLCI